MGSTREGRVPRGYHSHLHLSRRAIAHARIAQGIQPPPTARKHHLHQGVWGGAKVVYPDGQRVKDTTASTLEWFLPEVDCLLRPDSQGVQDAAWRVWRKVPCAAPGDAQVGFGYNRPVRGIAGPKDPKRGIHGKGFWFALKSR